MSVWFLTFLFQRGWINAEQIALQRINLRCASDAIGSKAKDESFSCNRAAEAGHRPMAKIIELIRRERTFDPQSTGVLVKAYERAANAVQGIDQSQTLREIIARRIVAAAMRGETNPERLCEAALAALARTETEPGKLS